MPIYEYKCEACGQAFEHFVRSSSDRSKPKCTACDSPKVARKLSVFAAQQDTAGATSLPPSCTGCSNANGGACPMQR